jgi:hypothetical protein
MGVQYCNKTGVTETVRQGVGRIRLAEDEVQCRAVGLVTVDP